MRSADRSDFEALRSRQGQAEAILVTYDIMEVDGQDVRPEPLEERRKRLTRLLSRSNKALRDGIQLSEAITGDGATIFLAFRTDLQLDEITEIARQAARGGQPRQPRVQLEAAEWIRLTSTRN